LKIDKYMLRGVWQALNCLSIHATYCVIVAAVSSAGCERAFSKLCIVKDELSSTMGDERLNGLMLMAVEKNIVQDLDLQTFVDMFESLEQTRMNVSLL